MYKLSSSLRSRRNALNCVSFALLAGTAVAAPAQTICYQNTTGGGSTYTVPSGNNDWLDPITLASTGSLTQNYWTINTVTIGLANPSASAQSYVAVGWFWGSVNTNPATSTTVVNSDFIEGFVASGTIAAGRYGSLAGLLTSFGGIAVPAGQTIGFELQLLTSSETAFQPSVYPEFYGNGANSAVSVGSAPNYFYQDFNDINTAGVAGSFQAQESLYFPSAPGDSNLYLRFSGTPSTPAPNSLAVLAAGAGPLLGLLRHRRIKSRRA